MKTGKKLLSVVLALLLALSFGTLAFAEGETPDEIVESGTCGAEGNNLTWTITAGGLLTISGRGEMKNFNNQHPGMAPWYRVATWDPDFPIIKKAVVEEGVTGIGDNAFLGCHEMTELVLPQSVTRLGEMFLFNCEKLETVDLPARLTKIGRAAFSYAYGLTHITIPDGVTEIEEQAFSACENLTSITIPESVETIGQSAFLGTKIDAFHVHAGLTSIGDNALLGTELLEQITVDEANPAYAADAAGCLFTKDMQTLLKYPTGNVRTEYTIPSSVKTIKAMAFRRACNLTKITVPEGVETIESNAFAGCTSLQSISLPDSVTTLGTWAFGFCGLESIQLPVHLTKLEGGVLGSCGNLKKLEIPVGVTCIGEHSLKWSPQFTTVFIPNTVESIGQYAFEATGLTDVYFGGTEAQWNQIAVDAEGNDPLLNATVHFLPGGSSWITLPYGSDGLNEGDWYLDTTTFMNLIGRDKSAAEKAEALAVLKEHVVFYYNPVGTERVYKYEYTNLPVDDGDPISGTAVLPQDLSGDPDNATPYDYEALQQSVKQYTAFAVPETPDESQDDGNLFQKVISAFRAFVRAILSFFRRLF
ncbi:MAG: leucine-rich repeat domain-containing protein [Clostridia bacterium]|nr:leucine-rich repeat domain-containing protein [Clostridia bacterium]